MSSKLDEQGSHDLLKQVKVKLWNRLKSMNKLYYNGNVGEGYEEQRARIESIVDELLIEDGVTLSQGERRLFLRSILTFDAASSECLETLLIDDTIQEIVVIGPHQVLIRRADSEQFENVPVKCFDDEDHLLRFIYRLFMPLGYHVDIDNPFAQVRTPDGSQVRVLLDTLGTQYSVLIIQRAASQPKKQGQNLDLLRKTNRTSTM